MAIKSLNDKYMAIAVDSFHPQSVDKSDITLALLTEAKYETFRVAQIGFKIHNRLLEIMNIQGAGPRKKLSANNVSGKGLMEEFRDQTCLKPLNTLLTSLGIFSRSKGLDEIIWKGENANQGLNYKTVLFSSGFREDEHGIMRLDTTEENWDLVHYLIRDNREKLYNFVYLHIGINRVINEATEGLYQHQDPYDNEFLNPDIACFRAAMKRYEDK